MRIWRILKNRRGHSVLEGALVTLVFLATLIGIFDLAQVLFIHQTFVARARSAARYGVLNPDNADGIRNMVIYGQTTVPPGPPSGIFGLTSGMVTVSRRDSGANEDRIVVTIANYPYRLFSPWIGQVFTARPVVASFSVETP
jgi:hypothetical protein